MKKSGVLALAIAAVISGAVPVMAQSNRQASLSQRGAPAIPAALLSLLQSYPSGGEGLTAAIADVLVNDPTSAAAVVALAKIANPDQKGAIAVAILRAIAILDGSNPEGSRIIRSALLNADPVLRAILAALSVQLYAQNGQGYGRGNTLFGPGGGGFSGGGGGGNRPFVSPN